MLRDSRVTRDETKLTLEMVCIAPATFAHAYHVDDALKRLCHQHSSRVAIPMVTIFINLINMDARRYAFEPAQLDCAVAFPYGVALRRPAAAPRRFASSLS
jgi:hypothetical protein